MQDHGILNNTKVICRSRTNHLTLLLTVILVVEIYATIVMHNSASGICHGIDIMNQFLSWLKADEGAQA
jgi:hypothetical protein